MRRAHLHDVRPEIELRRVDDGGRRRHRPKVMDRLAVACCSVSAVLNCRPVGALKPRGRVRFAMRLRIPTKSSVGSHGLTWELAPTTHGPPFTTVRVIVSR